MKQRKKRISHEESIRIKISELEESIRIREEHFEWIEKHRLYRSAIGHDTIEYLRDMPLLRQQLKSLRTYYKEKFETDE